jgi:hypothetical protein
MFVFVYMILTLFLRGASPPVNPQPTALFYHRFIDLSLISRHGASPPREPPTAYGIVFCLKTEMRTRRRLTHLSAVGGG